MYESVQVLPRKATILRKYRAEVCQPVNDVPIYL
jgi:hypothetical protein